MTIVQLKIATLSGATDAAHLEKALEAVPRVHSARIDSDAHSAIIEHDGADPGELVEAARRLGYPATVG